MGFFVNFTKICAISALVMSCSMMNAQVPSVDEFIGSSYIADLSSPENEKMSEEKKDELAFFIRMYSEQFKAEELSRFYTYQQSSSGMKPSDIQQLKIVMNMLKKGETPTKKQNLFLQNFIVKNLAKNPRISLDPALQPLAFYVRTQSNVFTVADFNVIKKAELHAALKTAAENVVLNKLADQNVDYGDFLEDVQVQALNRVMVLAQLDFLDVCDPKKLLVLQYVINNHLDKFKNVEAFNRKVERNQLVQAFKKENPNFSPSKLVRMKPEVLEEARSGRSSAHPEVLRIEDSNRH